MRRRQAFKFELLPRGSQQCDMHRFAGACRYVFNQALALQKANYEGGGFRCTACTYENHADVVGAMNILARGYRVAACGEEGSGLDHKLKVKPASVKQEPTEATMREVAHA
jgi:transposase